MTKLDHALQAAERGWAVFPCIPNGKIPATSNGFKSATVDAQVIMDWWNLNPEYNIGIATGKVSGLLVLDIDDPDLFSHEGPMEVIETLDCGYTVSTPSGGYHWYIQGEGYRNSVKRLPGADIRCEGGYVVGAGSTIDGIEYTYKGGLVINIPQELDKLLNKINELPSNPLPTIEGKISEGGRNDYLTQVAGLLQRKGLLTEATLQTINRDNCSPPLTGSEVSTIFNSVSVYEVSDPIVAAPIYLTASSLKDSMKASLTDKEKIKGKSTGFIGLDWLLGGGLREGELTGLCANAKTGKSSLIHQIMHTFLKNNIPVGYASREMRPHDEVLPNLLSIEYDENAWKKEMTIEREYKYNQSLDQWPLYFTPGYGTYLVDKIEEWVTTLVKLDVKYYFLDHLHYCLNDPEEYKEAVKLAQSLKRITNEYGISIFSIIQPTKIMEGMSLGLHALRGGAGIGQAIDTLMTFERYYDYHTREKSQNVSVLKVSDIRHKLGRTGSIYLEYNHDTTKFIEVKKEK